MEPDLQYQSKRQKEYANPDAKPEDLSHPGHVFPLRAKAGGVLERDGHTEATIDLMKLAGLNPAGVLCEVTLPNGTMARMPDVIEFSKEHDNTEKTTTCKYKLIHRAIFLALKIK